MTPGAADENNGMENGTMRGAWAKLGRAVWWGGLLGLGVLGAGAVLAADQPIASGAKPVAWRGFIQAEAAHAYKDPSHWSVLQVMGEVGASGKIGASKWKATLRAEADGAYDAERRYGTDVRNAERFRVSVRETYLDTAVSDWELRLGRQHVVWGEMVGLFVADVVSARDLRQFYLPEFEQMRIPQWAVRAERFSDDSHFEVIWVPVASYDDIGKPGMDFYPRLPVPQGVRHRYGPEVRPDRRLSNSNFGIRSGQMVDGWDLAVFAYRSLSVSPSFERRVGVEGGLPTLVFVPRHDRILQLGATFSKDAGSFVVKGESVWTQGRSFETGDGTVADGLIRQRTLDYGLGVDVPLDGLRLNGQVFGRWFSGYDPRIGFKRNESGISGLANYQFSPRWETEVLVIRMLARSDWEARAKLVWHPEASLRVALGVDAFGGQATGIFGQYAANSRAYVEARYSY